MFFIIGAVLDDTGDDQLLFRQLGNLDRFAGSFVRVDASEIDQVVAAVFNQVKPFDINPVVDGANIV